MHLFQLNSKSITKGFAGDTMDCKNTGSTKALEHVRSKTSSSALFAAGIEGSEFKWVNVQWHRLMRASLGYEPDDGSYMPPPNIALEEQSGQLPGSQEVRSSNSSLLARLSVAQGHCTMSCELMASMLESGTSHHLSQNAVHFMRRKTSAPDPRWLLPRSYLPNDSGQSAVSSLERAEHSSIVSSPQGNFPR